MIKVRVTRENGVVSIECVGHSAGDVCRSASMIMQAAALGLRDLAALIEAYHLLSRHLSQPHLCTFCGVEHKTASLDAIGLPQGWEASAR